MRVIRDDRGEVIIQEADSITQMFISRSYNAFTFRGMHYQTDPEQIKTIKVVQGLLIDFLYNLKTKEVQVYELHCKSELLEVPKGWAHGFLTLEPYTIIAYTMLGTYNPETYTSIPWYSIPEVQQEVLKHCTAEQITISSKDNQSTLL